VEYKTFEHPVSFSLVLTDRAANMVDKFYRCRQDVEVDDDKLTAFFAKFLPTWQWIATISQNDYETLTVSISCRSWSIGSSCCIQQQTKTHNQL